MDGNETIWFELRPDGEPIEDAERCRERPAAEQAATAMLNRQPELQFVEIAECGEGRTPTAVGRISAAQPPAPADGEIDDLHKLPRGAPEQ
jgi:hypothetical protein